MSFDALDALEAKIQQAAERIGELTEQKADLEHRVTELEAELAGAEQNPGAEREAEWAEEKAELKRRIEQLVARLEELLEG
jgi:FtsZ-binding cell division protein ZapB